MDEDDQNPAPLALDAWHRARGARMVPFAGYLMPIQYEGIIAEHLWTRAHAGLFDVSHMGQLLVHGDGAADALERLLPGDIAGLAPGRVRYSLLLADHGGILDDLMVTRIPDGSIAPFYMVVNGATKHDDIVHMRRHLPDGVTIEPRPDWALLALQGPEAVAAAARLIPGVESLGFMEARSFRLDGVPMWISRSGYTGEDGLEIAIAATRATGLADALAAQPEVKPIGLGARDSLRLEAGLPLYGHDLDLRHDPIAAGLAFAIARRRRAEGGFPGAEAVLRSLAEGSPERRVGLLIEGQLPAREGAAIFAGEASVGTVTSGGFAPSLNAPVAMGYVRADLTPPGTPLEIAVRGRRIAARVVPLPFVPHRYHRKER